ncbi:MAG: hypothetical protein O8C63_09840 [Candidatus Methanoperedens sp.]|nr:hypothetical protein [Candidatus Methanoperedens sp.]
MPRDIFGNVMETDIFGRKISKKQIKREVLEENRRKGKAAEDQYRMSAAFRGVEVERSPKGHDFIERERDLWTGKVKRTTKVEVKSSSTAPLSELQKKTKKKGNYKVERINPLFY